VRVVDSKLAKMRRDGIDEDHFRRWCWVARAILKSSECLTTPKLCTEAAAFEAHTA
jgi:hypothetical protein